MQERTTGSLERVNSECWHPCVWDSRIIGTGTRNPGSHSCRIVSSELKEDTLWWLICQKEFFQFIVWSQFKFPGKAFPSGLPPRYDGKERPWVTEEKMDGCRDGPQRLEALIPSPQPTG